MIYKILNKIFNINERLLFLNSRFLLFLATSLPSGLLIKVGNLKAIVAFNIYKKKVPAYKKFLDQNDNSSKVNSIKAFKNKIPIMDKSSYIYKYGIKDRCVGGNLPQTGNIDESAGSSGKATMWVRSTKEERKLQKLVDLAMHYTFSALDKDDLIVLNCWSTGPWATGVKFSQLAQRSSVVKSVGTDKNVTIETIQELGEEFEYLICGYPPFVKEIIDYGISIGLDWNRYRVNVLTGGEGFTEGWRNFIRRIIVGSNGEVYSAFGASDIDIGISFETDFTIKIKQLADKDIQFRKNFFGKEQMPIYFGQYNPLFYYIENSSNGNLLFSTINTDVCAPKIRYDLKDNGNIFTYKEVINKIQNLDLSQDLYTKKTLKLPFIAIYGRSDGTISLDGANIYPSDVQDAIYKSEYADMINSFYIDVGYSTDQSMFFKIYLELSANMKVKEIPQSTKKDLEIYIKDYLKNANQDYLESLTNNEESLTPRIEFVECNTGVFVQNQNRIKKIYYKK